jgi:U2 small nuclear ribonucleoprotein A'
MFTFLKKKKTLVGEQYYRLYVLNKIPTLKVLDFQKVKQSEREKARRLAQSLAGAALEGDIRVEARLAAKQASAAATANTLSLVGDELPKTFEPGQGRTTQDAFVISFTPEQKAKIRELIEAANNPEEIERIERMVQRGIFPAPLPSSA